jgi:hypothetical protein
MNTYALSRLLPVILASSLGATCGRGAPGPRGEMSFFITSVQARNGGDVGGLAGADAHCQKLATAVGSRKREWRAYLSVAGEGGQTAVNARDRIGRGPWFNVEGVQVAASLEDLHGPNNGLGGETSLNELGKSPGNNHDIMTGSNPDGTLANGDLTCRNWTSTQGRAMVGHSNKQGSCCGDRATSWTSAHESKGCTMAGLSAMGGAALFYCFAAD